MQLIYYNLWHRISWFVSTNERCGVYTWLAVGVVDQWRHAVRCWRWTWYDRPKSRCVGVRHTAPWQPGSAADLGNFLRLCFLYDKPQCSIAVWRSNIAIVLRQFKSVLLDLFLTALIIWISAVGTVCPHCTKDEICWPDSFFKVY